MTLVQEFICHFSLNWSGSKVRFEDTFLSKICISFKDTYFEDISFKEISFEDIISFENTSFEDIYFEDIYFEDTVRAPL